jgi:hypothetical protein
MVRWGLERLIGSDMLIWDKYQAYCECCWSWRIHRKGNIRHLYFTFKSLSLWVSPVNLLNHLSVLSVKFVSTSATYKGHPSPLTTPAHQLINYIRTSASLYIYMARDLTIHKFLYIHTKPSALVHPYIRTPIHTSRRFLNQSIVPSALKEKEKLRSWRCESKVFLRGRSLDEESTLSPS